jgi:thymidylate synthase (FAD)
MKVIDPTVEVTFFMPDSGESQIGMIEKVARICYQSVDKVGPGSDEKLVKFLLEREHMAMIEFGYALARIIADRGLTHELVRHRLASFAQESTRYVDYSKEKYGGLLVIRQPGIDGNEDAEKIWETAMKSAEFAYFALRRLGVKAQSARSVLPIGIKSEIAVGANLREWRHIFKLRCATSAHPIIRGVMKTILERFYEKMPALYEDQAKEFLGSEYFGPTQLD